MNLIECLKSKENNDLYTLRALDFTSRENMDIILEHSLTGNTLREIRTAINQTAEQYIGCCLTQELMVQMTDEIKNTLWYFTQRRSSWT